MKYTFYLLKICILASSISGGRWGTGKRLLHASGNRKRDEALLPKAVVASCVTKEMRISRLRTGLS